MFFKYRFVIRNFSFALNFIKSKTGREVAVALDDVTHIKQPRTIRTDKGREFLNRDVRKLLDTKNILRSATQNDVKANYAERFIKTIKKRLTKYMLHKQSLRYIDVLQDIVKSYNATYHRTIGMAPNKVTKKNSDLLWEELYVRPYWDAMQNKTPQKKP